MRFNPVSKKITEANIQAEIYHQCRLLNIPCYLEYRVRNTDGKMCSFDLVIYREFEIVAIIEVKSRTTKYKDVCKDNFFSRSKQYKKYSEFNVPILYINQFEDIPKLMNDLSPLLNN